MENNRLTMNICRLFYEENLSQKEIAGKLSVSRPQISRILSHARGEGRVTVYINNPYAEENALIGQINARATVAESGI